MALQDIPSEVIAAQFAGGMSIARLASEWDLCEGLVEAAVRHELRLLIPRWAGGLKASRDEMRRSREQEPAAQGPAPSLFEA